MRIAILTLPLHTNYGGILQAFALQTVLQRMGHKVEIVQKNPKDFSKKNLIKDTFLCYKRLIKKLLMDWKTPLRANNEEKIKALRKNTDLFIKKHIKLRLIDSLSIIGPKDYDAIVVGSDQIWRRIYFDRQYKDLMFSTKVEDAFLKFCDTWSIKRIAYAASFGVDKWEYSLDETRRCGNLLGVFDKVSLRETSGVINCKKYFGCEAELVLDPTLLLKKEDYIALCDEEDTQQYNFTNKIFCYVLDKNDNKAAIIEDISSQTGYEPFFMQGDLTNDEVQPSIAAWLKSFINSSLIVTDSFHACVFSIIFNKPFIAIGNKGRGLSRFTSLLELFGLADRLITEEDRKYPPFMINDWCRINTVHKEYREKSLEFLKGGLH